jgi:uncharacterized membrane protein YeaQ/YmgE (transglycosylase-associated protein family)
MSNSKKEQNKILKPLVDKFITSNLSKVTKKKDYEHEINKKHFKTKYQTKKSNLNDYIENFLFNKISRIGSKKKQDNKLQYKKNIKLKQNPNSNGSHISYFKDNEADINLNSNTNKSVTKVVKKRVIRKEGMIEEEDNNNNNNNSNKVEVNPYRKKKKKIIIKKGKKNQEYEQYLDVNAIPKKKESVLRKILKFFKIEANLIFKDGLYSKTEIGNFKSNANKVFLLNATFLLSAAFFLIILLGFIDNIVGLEKLLPKFYNEQLFTNLVISIIGASLLILILNFIIQKKLKHVFYNDKLEIKNIILFLFSTTKDLYYQDIVSVDYNIEGIINGIFHCGTVIFEYKNEDDETKKISIKIIDDTKETISYIEDIISRNKNLKRAIDNL